MSVRTYARPRPRPQGTPARSLLRAALGGLPLALLLGARAAAGGAGDHEALRQKLDALLSQPPLLGAHVSVEVVSLEDGRVVYAHSADEQLNPASNTKIITSAAALVRLGPEFRFSTDVLADRAPLRGRVRTLYVRGRGDPSITTERLDGLAADLWHRGLREVRDLVLDDTWFDREPWGPGWEQETSDKSYAAPVGALSLNHNSVGIYVTPAEGRNARARVELEPEARGFFILENKVATVKANARKRVVPHTFQEGERTRVEVSGRIPLREGTQVMYRRVTDPTFYFGYTLRQSLQQRGIRVTGRVVRAVAPAEATLLASYDSPALGDLVRDMNKVSSNFIAEMLIKALGAELRGAPGTWPKGLEVTEDLLAELGLARGTYQLRNGSGLNDTNRFSAHQLSGLLAAVYQRFPVSAEFVSSLGIAARDGTLRQRMEGTDAAGRLRAKTGTLEKVTALSGYVSALGGERFVFSMLVNDWAGRPSPVLQSVDRFGGLLAAVGVPELSPRDAQLSALAAQAEPTPAELKARVATYAALAANADKKNLTFLRSALRNEHDPLVKLVVADALYRTDPESGGGPLLEAMPAHPELFLRLRRLGRELALPVPVVSSLLDLGAEGNLEALARLCALAPLGRGLQHDEALEQALAEGLVDVGEAATDELLAALRAAPPAQAQAAVELIAVGLTQGKVDASRTLLGQLLKGEQAKEGAGAEQARSFLAVLEHRAPIEAAAGASTVSASTSSIPASPMAASGAAPAAESSNAAAAPVSAAPASSTPASLAGPTLSAVAPAAASAPSSAATPLPAASAPSLSAPAAAPPPPAAAPPATAAAPPATAAAPPAPAAAPLAPAIAAAPPAPAIAAAPLGPATAAAPLAPATAAAPLAPATAAAPLAPATAAAAALASTALGPNIVVSSTGLVAQPPAAIAPGASAAPALAPAGASAQLPGAVGAAATGSAAPSSAAAAVPALAKDPALSATPIKAVEGATRRRSRRPRGKKAELGCSPHHAGCAVGTDPAGAAASPPGGG